MRSALLIGLSAAAFALAPAAGANSLTKPNNDATLRPPHTAPYFNLMPRGSMRRSRPNDDRPAREPGNRRRR